MRRCFHLKLVLAQLSFASCILRDLTNLDFLPTGDTSGIAVSDLDKDGTLEVIVSVQDGPNKILKYDSATKKYYDVAEIHPKYDFIRDEKGRTVSVCTCDMDGDGVEELYLHNHNDIYPANPGTEVVPDKLFKVTDGKYLDLFALSDNDKSLAPRYGGNSVACVDRTGSGRYDVVVTTFTKDGRGTYRVFSFQSDNSSQSQIVEISHDIGLSIERDGRGVLVGALLPNNHYPDIFITNDNSYHVGSQVNRHDGRNAFFKNKGDGTFEDVAEKLGVADINSNGRGSAMGDFNIDGKIDLAFTNWLGPTRVFQQDTENSKTIFQEITSRTFTRPSAAKALLIGDFENDGEIEFFKAGANGDELFPEYNSIFRIGVPNKSRDVDFIETSLGFNEKFSNLKIRGIAAADVNEDGLLELFISHEKYHNRTFSIFQNDDIPFNWIRFMPLTKYGSFARGITVILTIGNQEERRIIIGGDCSYMCQSEPIAHFGLGKNIAKQVEIIWGDGHKVRKVLYEHDIRKTLVIAYSGKITYMGSKHKLVHDVSEAAVIMSYTCNLASVLITSCLIFQKVFSIFS